MCVVLAQASKQCHRTCADVTPWSPQLWFRVTVNTRVSPPSVQLQFRSLSFLSDRGFRFAPSDVTLRWESIFAAFIIHRAHTDSRRGRDASTCSRWAPRITETSSGRHLRASRVGPAGLRAWRRELLDMCKRSSSSLTLIWQFFFFK